MNVTQILTLPFSRSGGWKELQQRKYSIATLAWLVVLPMSLLPPIILFYVGTHYGDDFLPGFADKQWRFITTVLFLAELLTFFIMGWLIHAIADAHRVQMSYEDAYLLATVAPLPLWISSLALLVPDWRVSVAVILLALVPSCTLVYHGMQALCGRDDDDVVAMSATYTVMAVALLAWGLLIAMIWAF
ncbi:MAG: Yip1 family protein [Xanthomonadales bacterium]|nr:Yip1 family protein [Xanthomonadales bacterium]